MTHPLCIEHIKNALQSLRSTRTRSLLTTLGITIGIASITAILSMSGGLMQIITRQVDSLGDNIIVIRPGAPDRSIQSLTSPIVNQAYATSMLTINDATSILTTPGVHSVAPIMTLTGTIRAKNTTIPNGTVIGTYPSLAEIANVSIREGQFIDSVTARDTAVVGPQLAIDLYGTDQAIGKTFTIRGRTFTVIGITKRMNDPINFSNIDFDKAAIISLSAASDFHWGTAQIQQINIKTNAGSDLATVSQRISQRIITNHSGETDFTTLQGDDVAKPSSRLFIAITAVTIVVASISLVVGGIGVMNIMLVSVAERTREIGLRKAVGASNSNIIWQFLTESLLMSLFGGILGYILGYGLAFFICTFLTFDPAINWQIIGIAVGTALVVGTMFGLYPALRASRKDPIESLRQYH